jgi:hypothetical protein
VELGNLALELERVPTREAAPPLQLVIAPAPVTVEPSPAPSTPPTLTLVPRADAVIRTPAHHAVPAVLPTRLLADVAGWAGFAVVVMWVVIMASGHGVASASAWAGSLLGLVLAAVLMLVVVDRPHRTPGSRAGRED